jgi:hypothetical protein
MVNAMCTGVLPVKMASSEEVDISLQESGKYKQHYEFLF